MSEEEDEELEEMKNINDEADIETEIEEVKAINVKPKPSTPDQNPSLTERAGEFYESTKARVKDYQISQKEKKEARLEERRIQLEEKLQTKTKEAHVRRMEDKIRKQDQARRNKVLDRVRAPSRRPAREESVMSQALAAQPGYMRATPAHRTTPAHRATHKRRSPKESQPLITQVVTRPGKQKQSLALQAVTRGARTQKQGLAMQAIRGGMKPGDSKLRAAMLGRTMAPRKARRKPGKKRGRKK